MFNTERDEFYIILINDKPTSFMFQTFDEAVEHIQKDGSWDCRPNGGRMDEWYDPASGYNYKIQACDDCGRY